MASTALLGFLKGASAQGLDSLNARKAAEAEERKQKLLAQLRVDTEKEMAIFAEDLPSAKAKRELDANKDRREEEKLGLDRDKFAIDSELARSGDARADRLANAQIGAYNRSGSDGGRGGSSSLDSAPVGAASLGSRLVGEYKDTVTDLVKTKGVPAYVVEQTAAKVVANVRAQNPDASGAQLEEAARTQFITALEVLGTGNKPMVDDKGFPLLDNSGQPLQEWSPNNMDVGNDFYERRKRNLGG